MPQGTRTTTLLAASAVAIGLAFAGTPAAAQPGPPTSVTMGLVTRIALAWPLYVANAKGWFAENGVKIDFVITGGSARTVQQLAAGSVHIGHAGMPDLIRAIEQGAPVRIIAGEVVRAPYTLVGAKGIRNPAELKGKTISIGGSKDVTLIYLRAIMAPSGLGHADYDLVFAGSTSARYAALASGAVQAAILAAPFDFRALGEGYSDLGTTYVHLPDFPFTAYGVNGPWATRNRDAVVGLLRSYLTAIEWLYEPANREEAIAILIKETKADPNDAVKTYDQYIRDVQVYRRDGVLTEEAMQKMLEGIVSIGDLQAPAPPASKYIDDSFLSAARARR
jgi:NitT/TauT family transport system substrate-binding protein